MARARAKRGDRAARLGLAALVFVVLAAAGIALVRYTRGAGGYQIGVHFTQAAGVSAGSQVYLNGVVIGGVTKVKILPDTTVDFIINVFHDTNIPKNAQFTARASFTGTSSVLISVPPGTIAAADVWPKRVLPIEQQPTGTLPLTFETFMSSNQTLQNRSTRVLALARQHGKPLMQHLENSRANGAATMENLRAALPSLMVGLQSTIAKAKANAQDAQVALREGDRAKLAAIAGSFGKSAADLQKTSQALAQLKHDPQLRGNARAASQQLRAITGDMAKLSDDMQAIAGDSQTKAQLRDASARLRALLQKI